MARPVQLPAARRAARELRRLAVRARLLAAATSARHGVRPGTSFVLLGFVGAGSFAALWLRERRGAGLRSLAGSLSRLAPYLVAQASAGPPPRLGSDAARARALRLGAGLRRSTWWLALVAAVALASIPLSGQVHLALGAIPFFLLYALLRGRARRSSPERRCSPSARACSSTSRRSATRSAGGRSFAQVERYSAEASDFLSRDVRRAGARTSSSSAGPCRCSPPWGSGCSRGPALPARRRPRPRRARAVRARARRQPAGLRDPLAQPARARVHTRPGAPDAGRLPVPGRARGVRRHTRHLARHGRARRDRPGARPPRGALRERTRRRRQQSLRRPTSRTSGQSARDPRVPPTARKRASTSLLDDAGSARAPSGYSTLAPRAADRELRRLQRAPAPAWRRSASDTSPYTPPGHTCGGRLLARDGEVSVYALR